MVVRSGGFTKYKEIERIHLKFCKQILKVRNSTSSAGVYGELGRYPLYISRYIRIVKYWYKILKTDNIIIRRIYNEVLIDDNKGITNWVSQLKDMLINYGFLNVWYFPDSVNLNSFICVFKQRLIDCFIQRWAADKEDSGVLDLYHSTKSIFEYEHYLDLVPSNLRLFVTRLRISAHTLRIHTGRYSRNRIPRNERYCQCCNSGQIEDEYHFIIVCPYYQNLRIVYVKQYYRNNPSMFKFIYNYSSPKISIHYVNSQLFTNEPLKKELFT